MPGHQECQCRLHACLGPKKDPGGRGVKTWGPPGSRGETHVSPPDHGSPCAASQLELRRGGPRRGDVHWCNPGGLGAPSTAGVILASKPFLVVVPRDLNPCLHLERTILAIVRRPGRYCALGSRRPAHLDEDGGPNLLPHAREVNANSDTGRMRSRLRTTTGHGCGNDSCRSYRTSSRGDSSGT
jgi:hypothetical protein